MKYHLMMLLLMVANLLTAQEIGNEVKEKYLKHAAILNRIEGCQKGLDVIESVNSNTALKIDSFRDWRISIIGMGAKPGSTNDIETIGGVYVRIVNKSGRDLRPKSVWWKVCVTGSIQQVLQSNKLIILVIEDSDFEIIQTG